MVNYKGIDVYKLQAWTQGPSLLQALNIVENFDLKKMGYNSADYMHTIYQAMNLSFADRDFYSGDPKFATNQPMTGLLSKAYAKQRAGEINMAKNNANAGPGDPYPFEGKTNQKRKNLMAPSFYKSGKNKFIAVELRAKEKGFKRTVQNIRI